MEECESDAFERDPREFVERFYGLPNDTPMECLVDGAETCEAHLQALAASSATPDFIVCYSSDLVALRDVLELLGMVETQRFIYGINGIQIQVGNNSHSIMTGAESFSNSELTTVELLRNSTRFSLEEMVLFEKTGKS